MKHPNNGLSQNDSHHKNVNTITMGEAWKILFNDRTSKDPDFTIL